MMEVRMGIFSVVPGSNALEAKPFLVPACATTPYLPNKGHAVVIRLTPGHQMRALRYATAVNGRLPHQYE